VYRLRKALTTQLHTLRQELGPKEESLMRATEKLQETDREYELSLQVSSLLRAVVVGCCRPVGCDALWVLNCCDSLAKHYV
jgi:hypothetical protein